MTPDQTDTLKAPQGVPKERWSCACGARGDAILSFNAHTQSGCPMDTFTLCRWRVLGKDPT